MEPREVTETFAVAPQIAPEHLAALAGRGYTLVVNNRPDGEAPDQPTTVEMSAAARAAGLDFVSIPVSSGGFQMPQVDEMTKTLSSSRGKTLAYCRSGTRSIMLWALAQAKMGEDVPTICEQVSRAGYSATPIIPTMESISRGG